MELHPEFDKLLERAKVLLRTAPPFEDFTYRTAGPLYNSDQDIISGMGSKFSNGRWNQKGLCVVVYTSMTPETALKESYAGSRLLGVPDHEQPDRSIRVIQVKVDALLDLTDPAIRDALDCDLPSIYRCWRTENKAGREAKTQAIGRAAFDAGFHSIRCPSNADRDGGENLILFPTRFHASCRLGVKHPRATSP